MEKPITYVATYRGVSGFRKGLHEGLERDVLIAGAEIPGGNSFGGYSFVPAGLAAEAYLEADKALEEVLGRVDQVFVYLGAQGAGPGFAYLQGLAETNGSKDISIVACDCNYDMEQSFAGMYQMSIVWAECGGMDTLGRIVDGILREQTQVAATV